jgi:hypothetical protein
MSPLAVVESGQQDHALVEPGLFVLGIDLQHLVKQVDTLGDAACPDDT